MEDNAAGHDSGWTNAQGRDEGIPKVDWPPNSPDFNPILESDKEKNSEKNSEKKRRGEDYYQSCNDGRTTGGMG